MSSFLTIIEIMKGACLKFLKPLLIHTILRFRDRSKFTGYLSRVWEKCLQPLFFSRKKEYSPPYFVPKKVLPPFFFQKNYWHCFPPFFLPKTALHTVAYSYENQFIHSFFVSDANEHTRVSPT